MTEITPVADFDTEIADADIAGIFDALPVDEEGDPRARAEQRLRRLQATFATSMATVAEMYRDEDWKYLSRADGTPYGSLAEVFSDVMNLSRSMSRRYVQGARDFYLPLSAITVDGTRIEITSGDVASLGTEGLREAVDLARERLEGVDDPDAASDIISGAVGETKNKREQDEWATPPEGGWTSESEKSPQRNGGFDPGTSGGGGGFGGDDGPAPLRMSGGGGGDGDYMEDLPDPSPNLGKGMVDPFGEDDEDDEDSDPRTPVSLVDPADQVLEGATDYADPAEMKTLREPLRGVAESLVLLSQIDPREIAQLVDYDTRGILLPVSEAQNNISRLLTLVQTMPWFISNYKA